MTSTISDNLAKYVDYLDIQQKREVLASLGNLFLQDRYSKAQEFITQNVFRVAKKLFKYTASIR